MKIQPNKMLLASALALGLALGTANAATLAINSIISETLGTTAVIPGSGNATNTNTWSTGVVGSFGVTGFLDDNVTPVNWVLRVSASNPTGSLSSGTDSLMVARTVNSQGLTDNGTLSVYVRPTGTNTNNDAPLVASRWSLDLTFDFFTDNTFATAAPMDSLLLTSLDIDFNQRYYTLDADFDGGNFLSPGTVLTVLGPPNTVTGYTGFTGAGDSTFNNPNHAVSSLGTVKSSFSVQVSHDRVALFMFEFRNPSEIIPEPSTVTLAAISGFLLLGSMRRSRKVSR